MKRPTPLGGFDNTHSSQSDARRARGLSEAAQNERRHRQRHPFRRNQPRRPLVMQPEEIAERRRVKQRVASMDAARQQGSVHLSKKERRELKRDRKKLKPAGMVRTELNLRFAQQNIKDQPRKKQIEYVGELVEMMQGHMMDLVRSLDSTKVIQTCVKYGSQAQVLQMAQELKGNFIHLSCELYSHLTVQRMLEYGRKEVRNLIVSELMRAVVTLVTHKLAATVVDYAIMIAADENTRRLAFQYIVSRKYISMPEKNEETGKVLSLFDILSKVFSVPRMADTAKDLASMSSEMTTMMMKKTDDDTKNDDTTTSIIAEDKGDVKIARKHLLKNMEKFLISGIEKETVSTGIYQSILHAYMSFCSRFEFEAMFELLTPHLCEIQNVEAGSLAVSVMIGRSFYKPSLRKIIMKSLNDSTLIVPMTCEKTGYLTIIRMLQCIDDTRMLEKRVLKHIKTSLNLILFHDFGRSVILSIMAPFTDDRHKNGPLYKQACPVPIDMDTFKTIIIPRLKAKSTGEECKLDDYDLLNDPLGLDDVCGDFSRIDADDHSTWSVIPVRLRPVSRKPFQQRNQELMKQFWPHLLDFCRANVESMLTHDLAHGIIYHVLRLICSKMENDNNNNNMNSMDESDTLDKKERDLISAVIKCCLKDRQPIILPKLPKMPEPPNLRRVLEFINADRSYDGDVMNLYSEDELKKQRIHHHSLFLISKLEYDKILAMRKRVGGPRRARDNSAILKVPCVMDHPSAHRKIRQLVKDFDWFRQKFHNVMIKTFSSEGDESTVLSELLKMRGVFVFVQFAQSCTEEERQELKWILLEPAQSLLNTECFCEKSKESDNDDNDGGCSMKKDTRPEMKLVGLRKLISILEV